MFYYFRMEYIDGAYYVGFDFSAEGQNPNEQVQRDYIYNDWIVKIVPGKGMSTPPTEGEQPQASTYPGCRRIIVEDLVANINNVQVVSESDWDYNDVVFDAVIVDGKVIITVLNVGASLDLFIEGEEVHDLCGIGRGVYTAQVEPTTFVLENTNITNIKDIKVTGGKTGIELKAENHMAPSKICVGTDYVWCSEGQDIKTKYAGFTDWVKNENPETDQWYK